MSQLQSTGNSNSWGAVDQALSVQQQSTQGMQAAVGATQMNTSVQGGINLPFIGNVGGTTVSSPIGDISAMFTGPSTNADIAGMNVENIPQIINAIDTYVNQINGAIGGLDNADEQRRYAFKGEELQNSVAGFINAVREHLLDTVSHLRAFNQRLRDVSATYQANVAANAANIATQANTIEGATARYGGE